MGRVQLFHALTFGLRQLETKVKLRTESAEDPTMTAKKHKGNKSFPITAPPTAPRMVRSQ
jgi:hypothetical protein